MYIKLNARNRKKLLMNGRALYFFSLFFYRIEEKMLWLNSISILAIAGKIRKDAHMKLFTKPKM